MRTAPPASLEGVSTGSADIAADISRATRASIVGRCDRILGALSIALGAEIERRIDRRLAGSTAGFVIGTIAAASRTNRVVRRVLERYRTASLAFLQLRSVGVPATGCGAGDDPAGRTIETASGCGRRGRRWPESVLLLQRHATALEYGLSRNSR